MHHTTGRHVPRHPHWRQKFKWASILVLVLATSYLLIAQEDSANEDFFTQTLELPAEEAPTVLLPDWQEIVVTKGDSPISIFKKAKVSIKDLHKILIQRKASMPLRKLIPGQTIRILTTKDHHLKELVMPLSKRYTLSIKATLKHHFAIKKIAQKTEHVTKFAQGKIAHSLYLAGAKAGLSQRQIMDLSQIFSWQINFARDVRPGDRFQVLYDQEYLQGQPAGRGAILAAKLVTKHKTFQAYRFKDHTGHTGYYTADGKSLRASFIRFPVKYGRISSHFRTRRKHPLLHFVRPHYGVDLTAPYGTPIKASSDGKIKYRGRKGGYGNVVILQHAGGYGSVYGHMKKFAKGQHVGSTVRRGQVIGYVGSTGLATGPHLHYEIRYHGKPKNPEKIKLPMASAVPKKDLKAFKRLIAAYQKQMQTQSAC